MRDGAWLDAENFPPLRYAVGELIPEGLTLIVGPPKAGKSWLILDVLLGIAVGGVTLGRIKAGEPRRVFYIALEDGDRRMQDRCRALLGESPIPPLFHYKTRVEPGMILPTVRAFLRRHSDTALVVIDTLGKVMPPAMQGETAYQRDYRVASALKAAADAHDGLSLTVLHHDRKAAADDFVDSVSGTHGLAGAADTVMVLLRKRQSDQASLKVTGRDIAEDEYALTMVDGMAWQLAGADLAQAAEVAAERAGEEKRRRLSATMTSVLAFVQKRPEGVTAELVVKEFGKGAYTYLRRLVTAGEIRSPERGYYISLSEVSEVSVPQVSGTETATNTGLLPLSEVSETGDPPRVRLGGTDGKRVSDRYPPCDKDDPQHATCWELSDGWFLHDGRCLQDGAS